MNPLTDLIREEISKCGAISFARFMALALYCPVYGFYEKKPDRIGRDGDFYTSVSVGPLFGELLAFQFTAWISEMESHGVKPPGGKWSLVEAGAHDGKLARDILNWLREKRPALFERTNYVILEPSAARPSWQSERLAEFSNKVEWRARLGLSSQIHGVIFGSELLDAMPVHRLGWDARGRKWFEWGVAWENERFAWWRMAELSDEAAATLSREDWIEPVRDALPDEYVLELCPAAIRWWKEAATALHAGFLVTVDYGHTREERTQPERRNGTLRGYSRHRDFSDVLVSPGEIDLTAHVDFSAIQLAGEAMGLKTVCLEGQGSFLTKVAGNAWKPESNFGDWSESRTRQFQTLVHPEHLGSAFRVLAQRR